VAWFKVVYDNRSNDPEGLSDWGFSCFIKGKQGDLLFDTGAKPEVLSSNLLNCGLKEKDCSHVFISHDHWDHTDGLPALCPSRCWIPSSSIESLGPRVESLGAVYSGEKNKQEILPGMWSTGLLDGGELPEQALVVETKSGLVVLTGCAHPGVLEIIEHVTESFGEVPFCLMGGFHLYESSDDEIGRIIRALLQHKISCVGPCHCTGEKAIAAMKKAWGDNCFDITVGWEKTIE